MAQIANSLPRILMSRPRIHPVERLVALRNNNTLGHVAAVLVFVGLFFAVATDGDLPLLWSRLLFGALIIFDVLMVDWLIR